MINFFIILTFLLSVAAASGSILIASKLRDTYKTGVFSTLLYYQTFYFTFGFYAIWGQVILITFLSPFVNGDILDKTINILILLGSPFVALTWFMLVKFARELSGRKVSNLILLLYVLGTLLLMTGLGYAFLKLSLFDPFEIIKICFLLLNLGYFIISAAYLLFNKQKKNILRRDDIRNIAYGMLILMLLQNLLLMFYNGNIYIALAFINVFFIGGTFIPLYVRYMSDLSVLQPVPEGRISFDSLCVKFDISPREKEIIREICNGLSNQQIADKLFISLQTVKDHSSRIYSKINCSSRAQLIALVNENTV